MVADCPQREGEIDYEDGKHEDGTASNTKAPAREALHEAR